MVAPFAFLYHDVKVDFTRHHEVFYISKLEQPSWKSLVLSLSAEERLRAPALYG